MKAMRYEGKIDITQWEFPDWDPAIDRHNKRVQKAFELLDKEMDSFAKAVMDSRIDAINKTIIATFKENGVDARIGEDDSIQFGFPLGPMEGDLIVYKARLSHLIEALMLQTIENDCEEAYDAAKRNLDALQAAVNKLAAFIERSKNHRSEL